MYSDIKAVNILTSLLVAHGVRHAVVCPGSRNAPICHNLAACGEIECHPMTDERSAGFFAIGVSQANGLAPVAVCVTSGSAILDVSPAVAEAHYQRVPLIVIAADRPAAWIGQLDGQTMPQLGAFGPMARRAVSLPEGESEEDLWHANRLINEALMDAADRWPVLINVPLHEPLYQFTTAELPAERKVERLVFGLPPHESLLASLIRKAARPMLIIGQTNETLDQDALRRVAREMPVFSETISSVGGRLLNECAYALRRGAVADADSYAPDLIIYAGGTLVGKDAKAFIRSHNKESETILISSDGELHDVFMNTAMVIRSTVGDALRNIDAALRSPAADKDEATQATGGRLAPDAWRARWEALEGKVREACGRPATLFSQLQVMQRFAGHVHQVGNSSAVRLLCLTQKTHAFCNRGINGIDGSLSTAAGFAACMPAGRHCLCAIGDLSFFYDQNALWNRGVDGRLRILLLNNGGGGIFSRFEGLKGSPAKDAIVMARHDTSARGICAQNGADYMQARDAQDVDGAFGWLTTDEEDNRASRARLLEVFTDIDYDAEALKTHYENMISII